jgi:UDP-GlcNAc:undecaprenyl-phosphate/decaprenyl-phosphate GlcNAc-1-phosphate transferase
MQYLALTFISTLLLLFLLLKTRLINLALDQPNHRSLHAGTIPRTGGLAVMIGVLITWGLVTHDWIWLLIVLLLAAVSMIDDMRGLSVIWRLLAQILACVALVWFGKFSFDWWALMLMLLGLVWMTNLYNFMDGADGLAGGMALFGFGFYGLAAYLAGDLNFAILAGSISAAALGFLLFNLPPARIFMGDAGSIPLGFLAGSMGLYGWQGGLWPVWYPALIFSPFIVDATVTLFKRLMRKEKIWQAHKSHYYQRLVQMGWSHQKTAIAEYGLMLAAGLSAIFLLQQTMVFVMLILAIWVLFYWAVIYVIDKRWAAKAGSASAF